MNGVTTPTLTRVDQWHELYQAALFETDKEKIPSRIADAEQAIVARARELFFSSTDNIEEDQALDALCTRYEPCRIAPDWIQPPPELARGLIFGGRWP